jgi:glycosyltransferase involved in cell wall biosynthesis
MHHTSTAKASRLNVMQMIDTIGGGGAEKAVVDLALHLNPSKYNVTVCATRAGGNYLPMLERAGRRVLILGRHSRFDVRTLDLVRILRRRRIHILHTHLFGSNTLGRLLGTLAGVPIIISHEHWAFKYRREVLLDSLLYRLSDRIMVTSEAIKREVMRLDGTPARYLSVVYNGVDTSIFSPGDGGPDTRQELGIDPDAIVVGMVARLDVRKGGQDLLIRAVSRLRRSYPKVRLLMVGDGPLRPELESLAASLGESVIFAGVRTDVARVLRAMNVFALPSLYEALPIAMLEAMATGLPVIATRVGGIAEAVQDGRTGLLVPPGDEDALYHALGTLVAGPIQAEQMGRRAMSHIRAGFTIDVMARRVEAIYDELAGVKGLHAVKSR